jgi:glucose-1-phosphate thymidylyltransferase
LPLNKETPECVGLIPAAGKARRIAPLPCSKEIFPVGFGDIRKKGRKHPKVAAHYLLESMHRAGAQKAYLVLSKGKWDIPAYFGSGSMLDMALGYLMTELPYGVPFTLDNAFPFIADKQVLFGFPDIIFEPKDAFVHLLNRLSIVNADLVLGLFPAINPETMDMVDLDASGKVRGIHIKPVQTKLKHSWIIAAWKASFTQFMHDFVSAHQKKRFDEDVDPDISPINELFVGDVIHSALNSDLKIDHVSFSKGSYIDIGTPEEMIRAAKVHIPS